MSVVTVRGERAVIDAIRKAATDYPLGLGVALYKTGVSFIAEAVRRAPIRYGTLRRSAYVSAPYPRDRPRVELGFGVVYARAQHEGDFKHRDGERFYFLNAIRSLAPRVAEQIASWAAAAAQGAKDTGSQFPRAPIIGPPPGQARRRDVRLKFRMGAANMRSRTGR